MDPFALLRHGPHRCARTGVRSERGVRSLPCGQSCAARLLASTPALAGITCSPVALRFSPVQSIVGSTPMDFSVTDDGDASFTIPVPLAPATKGFAPQLQIEWGSGTSTIGFSVGAGAQFSLPIISRRFVAVRGSPLSCGCLRSVTTAFLAVAWTRREMASAARSCLTRTTRFHSPRRCAARRRAVLCARPYAAAPHYLQRLVAVTGAYGADGTLYTTETSSNARITGQAPGANGTESFVAQLPSGTTLCLGCTPDSRFAPAVSGGEGKEAGAVRVCGRSPTPSAPSRRAPPPSSAGASRRRSTSLATTTTSRMCQAGQSLRHKRERHSTCQTTRSITATSS